MQSDPMNLEDPKGFTNQLTLASTNPDDLVGKSNSYRQDEIIEIR